MRFPRENAGKFPPAQHLYGERCRTADHVKPGKLSALVRPVIGCGPLSTDRRHPPISFYNGTRGRQKSLPADLSNGGAHADAPSSSEGDTPMSPLPLMSECLRPSEAFQKGASACPLRSSKTWSVYPPHPLPFRSHPHPTDTRSSAHRAKSRSA